MNIDTGRVYQTKEDALRDGVPEDKIVTGSPSAIETLKAMLFPQRRRTKLRRREKWAISAYRKFRAKQRRESRKGGRQRKRSKK